MATAGPRPRRTRSRRRRCSGPADRRARKPPAAYPVRRFADQPRRGVGARPARGRRAPWDRPPHRPSAPRGGRRAMQRCPPPGPTRPSARHPPPSPAGRRSATSRYGGETPARRWSRRRSRSPGRCRARGCGWSAGARRPASRGGRSANRPGSRRSPPRTDAKSGPPNSLIASPSPRRSGRRRAVHRPTARRPR